MILCQVMPGGVLKHELTKIYNKDKVPGSVLIIEDGGELIDCGFRSSDLMQPKGCFFKDPNCIVNTSQKCDTSRVIYRITCVSFKEEVIDSEQYIGMTRITVHARILSH